MFSTITAGLPGMWRWCSRSRTTTCPSHRSTTSRPRSRFRLWSRQQRHALLGHGDSVPRAGVFVAGLKAGRIVWEVLGNGATIPDDRVHFDSHARIKDMDIEGVDVNMVLPSGGLAAFS